MLWRAEGTKQNKAQHKKHLAQAGCFLLLKIDFFKFTCTLKEGGQDDNRICCSGRCRRWCNNFVRDALYGPFVSCWGMAEMSNYDCPCPCLWGGRRGNLRVMAGSVGRGRGFATKNSRPRRETKSQSSHQRNPRFCGGFVVYDTI